MKNVKNRSKFHKKWPFFAIILPWMVRYGSETSFLLIFSARDDLVKVSWTSDARKCQNQVTLLTLTSWVKGTSPFVGEVLPIWRLTFLGSSCNFQKFGFKKMMCIFFQLDGSSEPMIHHHQLYHNHQQYHGHPHYHLSLIIMVKVVLFHCKEETGNCLVGYWIAKHGNK